MRLSLGKNKIDPNKTGVKLTASEGTLTGKEEINHEVMQNIENYFRAMISEDLDMNDLRFYDGDPRQGGKELTPDEAVAQLNGDYPLVAKHKSAPDAFPFVKRGLTLFTGEDIAEVPQHTAPKVDFDVTAFRAEQKPKEPGFFSKMLGAIGIKTASYRQYSEYNRKAELLKRYEKDLEKYEKEERAYAMGKGTEEEPEFKEDFQALADPAGKLLSRRSSDRGERAVEAPEAELKDGKLQIGDLAPSDPKQTAPEDVAPIPKEERNLLKETKQNKHDFEEMSNSSYMGVVLGALRASKGDEKAALKTMQGFRMLNGVPDRLTDEMFIEAAKKLSYLEDKRAESQGLVNEERKREETAHTLTEKEYGKLNGQEKEYFVRQENGTYQDRAYLKTRQTVERLENEARNLKHRPKGKETAAKDNGKHLTDEEHRILAEEVEEAKAIGGILKKVGENRSAAIAEASHVIADKLSKDQEGLDAEAAYRTVRFGNTMKSMTDTPEKIEQLAEMAKNDPEALNRQYLGQLKEHTQAAVEAPASAGPKTAENGMGEVKNAENIL